MARRDWLLLLMGFKGKHGTALDPVRIQKGMFLFAEEGGVSAPERYGFKPFHYGPYSFDLSADVDELVASGLAREMPVSGSTWNRYALTDSGMHRAAALRTRLPHEPTQRLFEIKQRVTGASFDKLLREVYDEYPDYATRSIFAR
jgi:uncharacterized protein YwgA